MNDEDELFSAACLGVVGRHRGIGLSKEDALVGGAVDLHADDERAVAAAAFACKKKRHA